MTKSYFVEFTKVNHFNDRKVREELYNQSLDDVFEILRFSSSCKRGLGLTFDNHAYSDGTICPENNLKEQWVNEDISIRPMTDKDSYESGN